MVIKHSKATKLFAAVLAILMVLAVTPATAFAATRKSVKSYKINFQQSATYMQKKATAVKKGTTNLTFKGESGLIKFKAPKKGYYTFTVTNCKTKVSSDNNCYFSVYKNSPYGNYITSQQVKTAGGKGSTLWLSINNHAFDNYSNAYGKPIKTRSAKKVKLKKGEMIYFYKNGGSKDMTCKLTIK